MTHRLVAAIVVVVALVPVLSSAQDATRPTVVVVGLGEQLLAGEAEAQLERTLTERQLTVIDERGLPEVQLALGDRLGPLQPAAVEALRPHADVLVLVTADYLGNRGLLYLNRYDEAYQARLTVTAVPLFGTRPPTPILNTRVEYTVERLESAAAAALRPATATLVDRLHQE
jgi:hypothetical protein